MKTSHYIGIDFGTSNSYFCITPENILQPNAICFDDNSSIETAVLWENDEIKDFGTSAVKGWGYASPDERKKWRLSLQFKPDIACSEQAKKDAAAFLASAAGNMKERNILPYGRALRDFSVIIGIPAKTLPGYQSAMNDIMREAGINNFKLVEEPIGALVHHLMRNDIRPEDVGKGIVVIDFGGGTCDVAFMLRLEVKHKFGDPILGGRLFDDLFYSWFAEQNSDVVNNLKEDDKFFLHWVKCREMKEAFSNFMRKNKNDTFKFYVDNLGKFDNATWNEFLHRAENYCPSKEFLYTLENYGEAYKELLSSDKINLIQRFRDAVEDSVTTGKISKSDVKQVVLTGGSSAWPFVKDIVKDVFLLNENNILQSANPRAAIGEGLVLLPGIQNKFNNAIENISAEQDDKVEEITSVVMEEIHTFCKDISNEFVERIFTEAVTPAVNDYIKTGGTIDLLNKKIEAKITEITPQLKNEINIRKPEIEAKIANKIITALDNWFTDNNIKWHKDKNIKLSDVKRAKVPISEMLSFPLEIEIVTATIFALITAGLLGGGGIHLLMSGPVGWIIGFVLGGVGSYFGIKKLASKLPVPAFIMKNKVAEFGIDVILRRAEKESKIKIFNFLLEQFDENRDKIKKHIANIIDNQIKSLDAINSI